MGPSKGTQIDAINTANGCMYLILYQNPIFFNNQQIDILYLYIISKIKMNTANGCMFPTINLKSYILLITNK